MATARNDVLPFLAAMTHHCKNRELTVAMAAAYELQEEHVSFVTGSGETTNKVESIVADAEELRQEAAVDHSGGAFEGAVRGDEEELGAEDDQDVLVDDDDDDATEAGSDKRDSGDDEDQAGLDEFF